MIPRGFILKIQGGTVMDFAPTPEQEQLVKLAGDFADKEMKPYADQWDETGEWPRHCFQKAAGLGFTGMLCPKGYGGTDIGFLGSAMVYEELSKGCMATTFSMVVHNNFARSVFDRGTKSQKLEWGVPAIEGKVLGAFCLTEPDYGSDAGNIISTALPEGDHYVINGVKSMVSNGGIADYYQFMARTDPAAGKRGISSIVVERDRSGVSFGPPDRKMGGNAVVTCQMNVQDCRVPRSNLLGEEGMGLKYSLTGIDVARANVGALCCGISQAALDEAVKYARERVQFGRPLSEFQGLQFMMADMASEIEAERLLTYKAAWLLDQGLPATLAAAYAKRFGADMAVSVTSRAVQVFGAYGYLRSYPVERYFRWAKMCGFIDGTTQIQQVVIARQLFK
jgi:alkylation response protein AidB-like acyl-CoA dehydrogenase